MRKTETITTRLPAFVGRKTEIDMIKTEIDTILTRLAASSAEHFNWSPDDICWADAGTLEGYLKGLRRVSDAAFHEDGHAA
jgi:hypothetical protein